jgi:O-antigen ligase
VFSWVLGFGFLIFFLFPKAGPFFLFLDSLGIHFHGDPHVHRFISPFFDPNYYGAIACIPLILAWQKCRYGLVILILLSIVLTFSRSGISTCGCVVLILMLFGRGRFSCWAFGGLVLLLLPLIFSQEFWHLIERTLHIGQDPSALARLGTFESAFSLFGEHPVFGTGYHYLSKEFHLLKGRLSPDSSVLITLVNFGLIPTLGMVIVGVWWSLSHVRKQGVIFIFHIYVVICILITSLFNNLLYYPYWLMPVIAMMTRMGGERDAATSSTRPRLVDPDGGR